MPSDLIVRCVPIKNVRPHPNADNLLIIDIMGWQVLTHKDTNPQIGELRVFIPPDAILSDELAQKLDIVKYLKKGNRVGQVKLRGEMSFGVAATNHWDFEIGEEVSEKLGITKYIPPEITMGNAERENPLFSRYTNVENFRNFPDEFKNGEEVLIMEKIEGTNSRVGGICEFWDDEEREGKLSYEPLPAYDYPSPDPDKQAYVHFVIGSHNTQKRMLEEDPCMYQLPLVTKTIETIAGIMRNKCARSVILYGEIFGAGVPNGAPSMRYGRGQKEWRLFDIAVDGKYLDAEELIDWAERYKLNLAPVLYRGEFSLDVVRRCANLPTALMRENPHLSEGVIIRPIKERLYDNNNRRLILKYKSDAYEELRAKGKAE